MKTRKEERERQRAATWAQNYTGKCGKNGEKVTAVMRM